MIICIKFKRRARKRMYDIAIVHVSTIVYTVYMYSVLYA